MQKIIIDIHRLKELVSSGKTNPELAIEFGVCDEKIRKTLKEYNIVGNKCIPKKHTEEMKRILSEKRKEYLRTNPDKHPWRSHNKFKSEPCEKLKEWLSTKNISFIPEYTEHGVECRNFSIDIAIPDKKIAIEVNGNQHYNRDGTLKPYYQTRNDLLESVGWKIYNLHYSVCFKLDKLEHLILEVANSTVKVDFDYKSYVRLPKVSYCIDCKIEVKRGNLRCVGCRKLHKTMLPVAETGYKKNSVRETKLNYCIDCNSLVCENAKRCERCYRINVRKVIRPSPEELQYLIWEFPFTQLAKKFGVSDNAIRKWCKLYNLTIPDNKYWGRKRCKTLIDYQI